VTRKLVFGLVIMVSVVGVLMITLWATGHSDLHGPQDSLAVRVEAWHLFAAHHNADSSRRTLESMLQQWPAGERTSAGERIRGAYAVVCDKCIAEERYADALDAYDLCLKMHPAVSEEDRAFRVYLAALGRRAVALANEASTSAPASEAMRVLLSAAASYASSDYQHVVVVGGNRSKES